MRTFVGAGIPAEVGSSSRPSIPNGIVVALHRSISYELIRLRATRSTFVLLGLTLCLGFLQGFNLVENTGARRNGVSVPYLVDTLQLSAVAIQLPPVGLLLFSLGSGAITAEYRHRLARTTFLTLPTRGLAYFAKLLVPSSIAVLAAIAAALLAASVTSMLTNDAFLADPNGLATREFWIPFSSYLVVIPCWLMIATGVAALSKSRVVTALFMTLWPLFGERLFGLIVGLFRPLHGIHNWLPFAAARAAMTPSSVTDSLSGSDLPGPIGLIVFIVFATLITAAGGFAYLRRDAP